MTHLAPLRVGRVGRGAPACHLMAGDAEIGIAVLHDQEIAIRVVMGIVAARTMKGAVGPQNDCGRDILQRDEFIVGKRVAVREGNRMMTAKIRPYIAPAVRFIEALLQPVVLCRRAA